jgi:hypothetical protein
MERAREALVRAMNPPEGIGWDAESQELNLLLFDLAADPPEGWIVQYEVCDGNGANPRNLEMFAGERRAAWRAHLRRRHEKYGDPDDLADIDAIPTSGHHALIVLKHVETGAEVRRWVDREALLGIVRLKNRTPAQKLALARVHLDAARADGALRVARKREALNAAGVGLRER